MGMAGQVNRPGAASVPDEVFGFRPAADHHRSHVLLIFSGGAFDAAENVPLHQRSLRVFVRVQDCRSVFQRDHDGPLVSVIGGFSVNVSIRTFSKRSFNSEKCRAATTTHPSALRPNHQCGKFIPLYFGDISRRYEHAAVGLELAGMILPNRNALDHVPVAIEHGRQIR
jgi:hypothetical protein